MPSDVQTGLEADRIRVERDPVLPGEPETPGLDAVQIVDSTRALQGLVTSAERFLNRAGVNSTFINDVIYVTRDILRNVVDQDLLVEYMQTSIHGVDPAQKVLRPFAWIELNGQRIHSDLAPGEMGESEVWGRGKVRDKFNHMKSFHYGMKGAPSLEVQFYDDNADNILEWAKIFQVQDEILGVGEGRKIPQANLKDPTVAKNTYGKFQFGWWHPSNRETYRSSIHHLAFRTVEFDYRGGGLYITANFVPLPASMMSGHNQINYKKLPAGEAIVKFHQEAFGTDPLFIPPSLKKELDEYTPERDWEAYGIDPVSTLEYWLAQALSRNGNPAYMVWADTEDEAREISELAEQERVASGANPASEKDEAVESNMSLEAESVDESLQTTRDSEMASFPPATEPEKAPDQHSDGKMIFIELEKTEDALQNPKNWLFGERSKRLVYGGTSPFIGTVVQDLNVKIDKNQSMTIATMSAFDRVERGAKKDTGEGETPNAPMNQADAAKKVDGEMQSTMQAHVQNGGGMTRLEDGADPEEIARAEREALNRKVRTFEGYATVIDVELVLLGVPYLDEIHQVYGKYFILHVIKPFRIATQGVNQDGYVIDWQAGDGSYGSIEPTISGYYIVMGAEHTINSDGQYHTTLTARRIPKPFSEPFDTGDIPEYSTGAEVIATE